jgi:hypothetical protein
MWVRNATGSMEHAVRAITSGNKAVLVLVLVIGIVAAEVTVVVLVLVTSGKEEGEVKPHVCGCVTRQVRWNMQDAQQRWLSS